MYMKFIDGTLEESEISKFCHCCDKTSHKCDFRKAGFILACGYRILVRNSCWQESEEVLHIAPTVKETSENTSAQLASSIVPNQALPSRSLRKPFPELQSLSHLVVLLCVSKE